MKLLRQTLRNYMLIMYCKDYPMIDILSAIRKKDYIYHIKVALNEITVEIRINDHLTTEGLRNYFKRFICDDRQPQILIYCHQGYLKIQSVDYRAKKPEPGKSRFKEEFYEAETYRIVRKILTGMTYIFDETNNLVFGDCSQNLNQVINFVNNRYIQWRLQRHSLLLHASGIVSNDFGIALCGLAGAGKSTLALSALDEGFDFVSNDRLILHKSVGNLMIDGLVKYPRINPGTILHNPLLNNMIDGDERRKLKSLNQDDLRRLEQKYDLIIDDYYGENRFKLTAKLKALIILNWNWNSEAVVFEEIALDQNRYLMPAFMKSPGLFFYSKINHICDEESYLKLLTGCSFYEVSGGVDFRTVAKLLKQLCL